MKSKLCLENSAVGNILGISWGIYPVISLNASFKIDTNDVTRDGSTAVKAWKIIKK